MTEVTLRSLLTGIAIGAAVMTAFYMWGGANYDIGFAQARQIYEVKKR